jgi:hypothetical protein
MKHVLSAAALVFVLGILGFVYRNELERPRQANVSGGVVAPTASGALGTTACTDEEKICPDGSAVGRSGPNCSFTPCALPNEEIQIASSTIGFVLPSGYSADQHASVVEPTLLGSFVKPSSGSSPHAITIREYPTPAGSTGEKVMLAHAFFTPSGQQATSTKAFKSLTIRGRTFYVITLGRFEGQVDTAYYLLRTNDVLQFEIIEKDVANWTDARLDTASLPQNQALLQMLTTLQTSS